MAKNGKGYGISINGGTNVVNAFKMRMEQQTVAPAKVPAFRPLTSYVLPRQEERDAYRAIPSAQKD